MRNEYVHPTNSTGNSSYGITLRDYFAAAALQGICASKPSAVYTDDLLAKESYSLADAMLKVRNQ